MSTAFEIAKKISFHKQKSYSRFIVRLSIAATTISVAAILLTLSIVNGFQESIAHKVYSFWGHIRVASINGDPLFENEKTIALLKQIHSIKNIYPFSTQSIVMAYGNEMEGVVAKGIPNNTPIPFNIEGKGITSNKDGFNDQIVISDYIANKLNIPINASVRIYVINSGAVQQRKMKVTGFYHTGIEDYDKQFILADLQAIQTLNHTPNKVDGISIIMDKDKDLDNMNELIQQQLPDNWVATTIPNYYPQIFDWIGVQTINRNVAITILTIIAIVNLLTCLFILILERIPMIGTLTSLGASQSLIRQIFLYQASFICWIGIGLGTFIGLGLIFIQQYFGWIQLDESAYFIKMLPVKIIWTQVGLVVIGIAAVSYISFLLPTLWVKKIPPAKAIQFN